MAQAFTMERIFTKDLLIEQKEEMISLSKRVCKVKEEYLLSRFQIYEQVICLRRSQKLFGFQLIQTFEQNDEKFIYFGPLFSRMSCFRDLFLTYLQVIMEENQGRKIHLLAEIENPEVLFLFKALFEDYAYPKFHNAQVPDEIKDIVRIYHKRLSHIHNLDVDRMTTYSKESLYQYRPTHSTLEKWLHSRKIDFSHGMNIVLYSYVPAEPNPRDEFKLQLEHGIKRMANWKEGKKEMLNFFEGGIVNGV
ncbi:hypothetical protein RGU12_06735 [Fredinandcohnia sp. QZ13]|uniref:hypothetical protein n=1 Tax=Fredinandcohnia sp. QZ13 TaxID=3073144 RepID=UPI0028536893|nr:hypothetical protein [Fredinandcohnia sp. QZ13]MDR4887253.1 hypothetical protein [Fredinandcohnia sp. QZ13]